MHALVLCIQPTSLRLLRTSQMLESQSFTSPRSSLISLSTLPVCHHSRYASPLFVSSIADNRFNRIKSVTNRKNLNFRWSETVRRQTRTNPLIIISGLDLSLGEASVLDDAILEWAGSNQDSPRYPGSFLIKMSIPPLLPFHVSSPNRLTYAHIHTHSLPLVHLFYNSVHLGIDRLCAVQRKPHVSYLSVRHWSNQLFKFQSTGTSPHPCLRTSSLTYFI